MLGSEHNDEFYLDSNGATRTRTNRSGGIQVRRLLCPGWGGLSEAGLVMHRSGASRCGRLSVKLHACTARDKCPFLWDLYEDVARRGVAWVCLQGGISNGEDIVIRLAFKPTSTITVRPALTFLPQLESRAVSQLVWPSLKRGNVSGLCRRLEGSAKADVSVALNSIA